MEYRALFFAFLTIFLLGSCDFEPADVGTNSIKLTTHTSGSSGLDFSNVLEDDKMKSVFNYINAFGGGGVAIGDVNNDGLQDVYLTANMSTSKLYLNKGDLKFEDITTSSGTETKGWSTGVTMADVNKDGWLDIYVCRAYHDDPSLRRNLLFINLQDGSFEEQGGVYGIADTNYSIGASFLDYDRDGDLDLIVANHPRFQAVSLNTHYNYWLNPVEEYSDRLFRNDAGVFKDVTLEAGILNYSFSLSTNTSDLDLDGFPDIFISVDHDEADIIFHNNGDGTFTNVVKKAFKQSSRSSMGVDVGDVNHDPYPEIIVSEMLSEDHYREKSIMSMQTVQRFQYLTDTLGLLYYQMRNFLHRNNGNGTFSDISQLAGINKTDWSWSILFSDLDNDSWQDVVVVNGWYKEVYHKDEYKKFSSIMEELGNDMAAKNRIANEYMMSRPTHKLANYVFRNNGDLTFENVSQQTEFTQKTISTGSAYGDLDNDGDLDLVINNIGDEASLVENATNHNNSYLRLKLKVPDKLVELGSRVELFSSEGMQTRQLLSTRGYQSSSEQFIHFGLGSLDHFDKLLVYWTDGSIEEFNNLPLNQVHEINYGDGKSSLRKEAADEKLVIQDSRIANSIDYKHKENYYHDYNDQVLLPHKMSEPGPRVIVGDVNNDGFDDFFITSSVGNDSELHIQNKNGEFSKIKVEAFNILKESENTDAAFIDYDLDGDLDLLTIGGGYQFPEGSEQYKIRIFENLGKLKFRETIDVLPEWRSNASVVEVFDFENDGDLDFFIGASVKPFKYPLPSNSGLFINEDGKFKNKTIEIAPDLQDIGIIKAIDWTDINKDGLFDLVLVGEWMPISIWINDGKKLIQKSNELGFEFTTGWWNSVESSDLNGDGLIDLIVGNLGMNYKYKASKEKPFTVYGSDFDLNGTYDIVLSTFYGDVVYPVRGKQCSSEQIPELKESFPSYETFANANLDDVYGEKLEEAYKLQAYEFRSGVFYQREDGKFDFKPFPNEAQIAPVNGIICEDVNNDNKLDLIVGGNLYQSEIETGRADMGTGHIIINENNEKWSVLPVWESGLYIDGDVKDLEPISINGESKKSIIIATSRDSIRVIKFLSQN